LWPLTVMAELQTNVRDLCRELKITRQLLYRHVDPHGHHPT